MELNKYSVEYKCLHKSVYTKSSNIKCDTTSAPSEPPFHEGSVASDYGKVLWIAIGKPVIWGKAHSNEKVSKGQCRCQVFRNNLAISSSKYEMRERRSTWEIRLCFCYVCTHANTPRKSDINKAHSCDVLTHHPTPPQPPNPSQSWIKILISFLSILNAKLLFTDQQYLCVMSCRHVLELW